MSIPEVDSGPKGIFMCKSLKHCKKISLKLIWLKNCLKVHGYVLKRLAKFQQNLSVGICFTMPQSFSMKIRFVLESTYGIPHYVRSIPNTLSVTSLNFETLYGTKLKVHLLRLSYGSFVIGCYT